MPASPDPDHPRLVFLGGVGEIGRNMAVLELAGRALVLDAGLSFPEVEMLGIDLVLPDFQYVLDLGDQVEGVIPDRMAHRLDGLILRVEGDRVPNFEIPPAVHDGPPLQAPCLERSRAVRDSSARVDGTPGRNPLRDSLAVTRRDVLLEDLQEIGDEGPSFEGQLQPAVHVDRGFRLLERPGE